MGFGKSQNLMKLADSKTSQDSAIFPIARSLIALLSLTPGLVMVLEMAFRGQQKGERKWGDVVWGQGEGSARDTFKIGQKILMVGTCQESSEKHRVPKLTLFCYQQWPMKPVKNQNKTHISSRSDSCQHRKPSLAAASLAPEAKISGNNSVLTDGLSENSYLTKFEWLGNLVLSVWKYKQRYLREKKGYKSHASVQLYVRCITLMHHIIV